MESHTVPSEPTVSIDALETFVELLSRVESDPSSDAFYSRLCEATCRLADMDRAVIFRYDGARRRVRAAGQLRHPARRLRPRPGDGRDRPGGARVADRGPRDRDLERDGRGRARRVPQPDPRVDAGLHADGGRRPLAGRDPVRPRPRPPALRDSERHLLWTLGKTAALAAFARQATNKQAQARQLQERMDLAREVHESVIQRLFGIQLVFSQHGRAQPRGPRADRGRAAGRARRPAPRAPAPAQPQRARDADDAAGGGRAPAHASTATCT